MAKKDFFYYTVKRALEKDQWIITNDPLTLKVGGIQVEIDLGAENLIAADKNGEKIAVEIKSYIQPSATSEFHTSVGQYINYRKALEKKEPERTLFLAIPDDIYETFFNLPFIREVISENNIKIITYDPEEEIMVKWIR
jgi:hypothetical protein